MTDVTRILDARAQGDPQAADQLLPLVYDELRRLAAQKLAQEAPGQTLQATALVHEAYLRLVGGAEQPWNSRNHFLCAAAEAMRRILIEQARRKGSVKHGGGRRRVDLDQLSPADSQPDHDDLLAVGVGQPLAQWLAIVSRAARAGARHGLLRPAVAHHHASPTAAAAN
jgi:RNA polymerase sigma factor (TIGR02999 family)